jgi:formate/nitrite transporter FocA (FNT family)
MSFSLMAEGRIRSHLPDAPWRALLVGMGYPFGYLIVIVGRQQLFTENTLTLDHRPRRQLGRCASGRMDLGQHAHILRGSWKSLRRNRPGGGIGSKGILDGWLIAMVVWLLASSRSGHLAIVFILTFVVGLGQFTHVIAGFIDVLYLVSKPCIW